MSESNDFDKLILSGAIQPAGIDPDTGEMLYNFTKKLKHVHPVLYREVNNMFSRQIMNLWEKGMVDMDPTESNPIVRLTEKAFDKSLIDTLDDETLHSLKEIKRGLNKK
jgi:hypothetical protein